ncbi:glycosyltransferase family 2 protein [Metallosphaera tengchongensis]|uniref:Glycosyltransferase family 2 protein n=1 Tax=Metallosphaera tengchongensis TaxID=1532350 RepID=A0A6N0NZU9_9CREN|nr:glycosyltransferase family A protein [Metallosphaera tengchongensis]QKR00888.1 glycosyltransferase family 2 protein [Metallosphaera tengchongensis]
MSELDVQVAIPTHKNDGRTIRFTIEGLTKQTYKDFNVLIVYKPSEGDRTLDVVEWFSKSLDIKVIYQKEGYIEEAMNLIYSNANADLLLTIDDDNIPDSNWVLDHKNFHERYEDLGVARGKVVWKTGSSKFKLSLRELAKKVIYRQYSSAFDGYGGYLTIYGIPTDRRPKFTNDYMKTITIAAENMSVKREVYKGFVLPGYTLRGFHNEEILTLHAIKKDYFTAEIIGGLNKEIERMDFGVKKDSLSTPTTLKGRLNLIAEHYLFPYAANLVGFPPKYLRFVQTLLTISRTGLEREATKLGLSLAIQGIEHRLEPAKVREMLKKGLDELIAGQNNI